MAEKLDKVRMFNSIGTTSIGPFVRPNQGNASLYFNDADGNSLELMCYIEVHYELKHITEKLSFEDWESLVGIT